MLKKFMIEKVEQEQLTDTNGTITFHLVDEEGNYRTVKANTFLDENKEAKGVSTDNIRELPLIESLFSYRNKKIIEIEFDYFNQVYDRETNTTINQKAYKAVLKMQKENTFMRRISNIFRRKASTCLLYTSPSPRDKRQSRMPSSA